MNGILYLLYGSDLYVMKQQTQKILADHGIDSIDVEFFDMEETLVEEAVNAAMTIPFLSERKGVVLKNCSFLAALKPAKELDHLLPYLFRYLKKPNPTTCFILQAPYEKLDTRKQAYKVCQENCRILECQMVQKDDLYPMIRQTLDRARKTIDANALEEFVIRTNGNTFLALNELDKLILYADKLNNIDIGMVQNVTTRNLEDHIYELVNAILAKDGRSIVNIYQDLTRNNIEPTMIVGQIAGKFQEILYTKELLRMNRGFEDIMKYFNATKNRTYYIMKNAREVPDDSLCRSLLDLEIVDFRIKSGAVDKKMGLELYLLAIGKES